MGAMGAIGATGAGSTAASSAGTAGVTCGNAEKADDRAADKNASGLMGIVINAPFSDRLIAGRVRDEWDEPVPAPDGTAAPETLVAGAPVATRSAYLDVLCKEIEGADDVLADREVAFLTVKDSAAMLPTDGLARLIRNLKHRYRFTDKTEVTLELTPQTVCTASLTSLNVCKFTRLLLHVAAYDPASLDSLGKPWRAVDVASALRFIDKFYYTRPSFEVWYGVPGSTLRSLRASLDELTESSQIKEVVLRPYEPAAVEKGKTSGAAEAGGEAGGAGDENGGAEGEAGGAGGVSGGTAQNVAADTLVEQYSCAKAFLERRGFECYGAGRFFRGDGRDRSFLDRCNGVEWEGFGVGATSFMDGFVSRNTTDLGLYLAGGGDYTKTVAAARDLTERDLAAKALCDRLRLSGRIDEADVPKDPGLAGALQTLAADGYLEVAPCTDGARTGYACALKGFARFNDVEQTIWDGVASR